MPSEQPNALPSPEINQLLLALIESSGRHFAAKRLKRALLAEGVSETETSNEQWLSDCQKQLRAGYDDSERLAEIVGQKRFVDFSRDYMQALQGYLEQLPDSDASITSENKVKLINFLKKVQGTDSLLNRAGFRGTASSWNCLVKLLELSQRSEHQAEARKMLPLMAELVKQMPLKYVMQQDYEPLDAMPALVQDLFSSNEDCTEEVIVDGVICRVRPSETALFSALVVTETEQDKFSRLTKHQQLISTCLRGSRRDKENTVNFLLLLRQLMAKPSKAELTDKQIEFCLSYLSAMLTASYKLPVQLTIKLGEPIQTRVAINPKDASVAEDAGLGVELVIVGDSEQRQSLCIKAGDNEPLPLTQLDTFMARENEARLTRVQNKLLHMSEEETPTLEQLPQGQLLAYLLIKLKDFTNSELSSSQRMTELLALISPLANLHFDDDEQMQREFTAVLRGFIAAREDAAAPTGALIAFCDKYQTALAARMSVELISGEQRTALLAYFSRLTEVHKLQGEYRAALLGHAGVPATKISADDARVPQHVLDSADAKAMFAGAFWHYREFVLDMSALRPLLTDKQQQALDAITTELAKQPAPSDRQMIEKVAAFVESVERDAEASRQEQLAHDSLLQELRRIVGQGRSVSNKNNQREEFRRVALAIKARLFERLENAASVASQSALTQVAHAEALLAPTRPETDASDALASSPRALPDAQRAAQINFEVDPLQQPKQLERHVQAFAARSTDLTGDVAATGDALTELRMLTQRVLEFVGLDIDVSRQGHAELIDVLASRVAPKMKLPQEQVDPALPVNPLQQAQAKRARANKTLSLWYLQNLLHKLNLLPLSENALKTLVLGAADATLLDKEKLLATLLKPVIVELGLDLIEVVRAFEVGMPDGYQSGLTTESLALFKAPHDLSSTQLARFIDAIACHNDYSLNPKQETEETPTDLLWTFGLTENCVSDGATEDQVVEFVTSALRLTQDEKARASERLKKRANDYQNLTFPPSKFIKAFTLAIEADLVASHLIADAQESREPQAPNATPTLHLSEQTKDALQEVVLNVIFNLPSTWHSLEANQLEATLIDLFKHLSALGLTDMKGQSLLDKARELSVALMTAPESSVLTSEALAEKLTDALATHCQKVQLSKHRYAVLARHLYQDDVETLLAPESAPVVEPQGDDEVAADPRATGTLVHSPQELNFDQTQMFNYVSKFSAKPPFALRVAIGEDELEKGLSDFATLHKHLSTASGLAANDFRLVDNLSEVMDFIQRELGSRVTPLQVYSAVMSAWRKFHEVQNARDLSTFENAVVQSILEAGAAMAGNDRINPFQAAFEARWRACHPLEPLPTVEGGKPLGERLKNAENETLGDYVARLLSNETVTDDDSFTLTNPMAVARCANRIRRGIGDVLDGHIDFSLYDDQNEVLTDAASEAVVDFIRARLPASNQGDSRQCYYDLLATLRHEVEETSQRINVGAITRAVNEAEVAERAAVAADAAWQAAVNEPQSNHEERTRLRNSFMEARDLAQEKRGEVNHKYTPDAVVTALERSRFDPFVFSVAADRLVAQFAARKAFNAENVQALMGALREIRIRTGSVVAGTYQLAAAADHRRYPIPASVGGYLIGPALLRAATSYFTEAAASSELPANTSLLLGSILGPALFYAGEQTRVLIRNYWSDRPRHAQMAELGDLRDALSAVPSQNTGRGTDNFDEVTQALETCAYHPSINSVCINAILASNVEDGVPLVSASEPTTLYRKTGALSGEPLVTLKVEQAQEPAQVVQATIRLCEDSYQEYSRVYQQWLKGLAMGEATALESSSRLLMMAPVLAARVEQLKLTVFEDASALASMDAVLSDVLDKMRQLAQHDYTQKAMNNILTQMMDTRRDFIKVTSVEGHSGYAALVREVLNSAEEPALSTPTPTPQVASLLAEQLTRNQRTLSLKVLLAKSTLLSQLFIKQSLTRQEVALFARTADEVHQLLLSAPTFVDDVKSMRQFIALSGLLTGHAREHNASEDMKIAWRDARRVMEDEQYQLIVNELKILADQYGVSLGDTANPSTDTLYGLLHDKSPELLAQAHLLICSKWARASTLRVGMAQALHKRLKAAAIARFGDDFTEKLSTLAGSDLAHPIGRTFTDLDPTQEKTTDSERAKAAFAAFKAAFVPAYVALAQRALLTPNFFDAQSVSAFEHLAKTHGVSELTQAQRQELIDAVVTQAQEMNVNSLIAGTAISTGEQAVPDFLNVLCQHVSAAYEQVRQEAQTALDGESGIINKLLNTAGNDLATFAALLRPRDFVTMGTFLYPQGVPGVNTEYLTQDFNAGQRYKVQVLLFTLRERYGVPLTLAQITDACKNAQQLTLCLASTVVPAESATHDQKAQAKAIHARYQRESGNAVETALTAFSAREITVAQDKFPELYQLDSGLPVRSDSGVEENEASSLAQLHQQTQLGQEEGALLLVRPATLTACGGDGRGLDCYDTYLDRVSPKALQGWRGSDDLASDACQEQNTALSTYVKQGKVQAEIALRMLIARFLSVMIRHAGQFEPSHVRQAIASHASAIFRGSQHAKFDKNTVQVAIKEQLAVFGLVTSTGQVEPSCKAEQADLCGESAEAFARYLTDVGDGLFSADSEHAPEKSVKTFNLGRLYRLFTLTDKEGRPLVSQGALIKRFKAIEDCLAALFPKANTNNDKFFSRSMSSQLAQAYYALISERMQGALNDLLVTPDAFTEVNTINDANDLRQALDKLAAAYQAAAILRTKASLALAREQSQTQASDEYSPVARAYQDSRRPDGTEVYLHRAAQMGVQTRFSTTVRDTRAFAPDAISETSISFDERRFVDELTGENLQDDTADSVIIAALAHVGERGRAELLGIWSRATEDFRTQQEALLAELPEQVLGQRRLVQAVAHHQMLACNPNVGGAERYDALTVAKAFSLVDKMSVEPSDSPAARSYRFAHTVPSQVALALTLMAKTKKNFVARLFAEIEKPKSPLVVLQSVISRDGVSESSSLMQDLQALCDSEPHEFMTQLNKLRVHLSGYDDVSKAYQPILLDDGADQTIPSTEGITPHVLAQLKATLASLQAEATPAAIAECQRDLHTILGEGTVTLPELFVPLVDFLALPTLKGEEPRDRAKEQLGALKKAQQQLTKGLNQHFVSAQNRVKAARKAAQDELENALKGLHSTDSTTKADASLRAREAMAQLNQCNALIAMLHQTRAQLLATVVSPLQGILSQLSQELAIVAYSSQAQSNDESDAKYIQQIIARHEVMRNALAKSFYTGKLFGLTDAVGLDEHYASPEQVQAFLAPRWKELSSSVETIKGAASLTANSPLTLAPVVALLTSVSGKLSVGSRESGAFSVAEAMQLLSPRHYRELNDALAAVRLELSKPLTAKERKDYTQLEQALANVKETLFDAFYQKHADIFYRLFGFGVAVTTRHSTSASVRELLTDVYRTQVLNDPAPSQLKHFGLPEEEDTRAQDLAQSREGLSDAQTEYADSLAEAFKASLGAANFTEDTFTHSAKGHTYVAGEGSKAVTLFTSPLKSAVRAEQNQGLTSQQNQAAMAMFRQTLLKLAHEHKPILITLESNHERRQMVLDLVADFIRDGLVDISQLTFRQERSGLQKRLRIGNGFVTDIFDGVERKVNSYRYARFTVSTDDASLTFDPRGALARCGSQESFSLATRDRADQTVLTADERTSLQEAVNAAHIDVVTAEGVSSVTEKPLDPLLSVATGETGGSTAPLSAKLFGSLTLTTGEKREADKGREGFARTPIPGKRGG